MEEEKEEEEEEENEEEEEEGKTHRLSIIDCKLDLAKDEITYGTPKIIYENTSTDDVDSEIRTKSDSRKETERTEKLPNGISQPASRAKCRTVVSDVNNDSGVDLKINGAYSCSPIDRIIDSKDCKKPVLKGKSQKNPSSVQTKECSSSGIRSLSCLSMEDSDVSDNVEADIGDIVSSSSPPESKSMSRYDWERSSTVISSRSSRQLDNNMAYAQLARDEAKKLRYARDLGYHVVDRSEIPRETRAHTEPRQSKRKRCVIL